MLEICKFFILFYYNIKYKIIKNSFYNCKKSKYIKYKIKICFFIFFNVFGWFIFVEFGNNR